MNIYEYYTEHSKISDPENFSYLLEELPTDIQLLCQIVQNLVMHYADEDLLHFYIPKERHEEANIRFVSRMLELIINYNKSPLNKPREAHERIIGVCRETSILLCSILRQKKIPARLRVGFCPYFIPGIYLDGMCVEYWNDQLTKWCFVDTRTSSLHLKKFKLNLNFDLCDIPNELFISAAQAWKLCRTNKLDATLFGSRTHRGLLSIQDRLIQEFAVLNKKEILLWDRWGMMLEYSKDKPCNDEKLTALDELSSILIENYYDVDVLQKFYSESKLFKIENPIIVRNPFTPKKIIEMNI